MPAAFLKLDPYEIQNCSVIWKCLEGYLIEPFKLI